MSGMFIGTAAAAALCGMSERTFRRAIEIADLPPIALGARRGAKGERNAKHFWLRATIEKNIEHIRSFRGHSGVRQNHRPRMRCG